jgi:hypothetical protein
MGSPAGSAMTTSLRSERGAAMVEFAFVLPLLMTLVLGLVDFGRAINYWIDETHLATSAARWAVVNKDPATLPGSPASLQDYILSQADSAELRSAAQVCISFPSGTANVGDPVEVQVDMDYDWLPFFESRLGFTTTSIVGAATMRLEAKPTHYSAGCVSGGGGP